MFSIAQTFCLKPGCYAEYKQAHDDLWPEIDRSMAENQVSMAIFLYGERLFLHAVAPSEKDWDRSREHPALERWHAYMATLMVTDADGQTVVEELPEAFAFGMFS
ncbi:MAG: L-rhamnose mutarotase [Planctomycetaceae bacterium]|nr:L-rhamnose mutarotase [Planctomycetaceae bacterium]